MDESLAMIYLVCDKGDEAKIYGKFHSIGASKFVYVIISNLHSNLCVAWQLPRSSTFRHHYGVPHLDFNFLNSNNAVG